MKLIKLDSYQKTLYPLLKQEGFSNLQIINFFNSYANYQSPTEVFNDDELQNTCYAIFEMLKRGYSLSYIKDDCPQSFDDFEKFLSSKNLTIQDALAINRWSGHHDQITSMKRNSGHSNAIAGQRRKLKSDLCREGYTKEQIDKIVHFIDSFNIDEDYKVVEGVCSDFLEDNTLSKNAISHIRDYFIMKKFINGLVATLQKTLKTQLATNTIFFRSVQKKFLDDLIQKAGGVDKLIGCKIEDNGFTSTSILEDNDFSNITNLPVHIQIFAPKGSEGMEINPLSSFPNEYEFLFNANDLIIFDIDKDSLREEKIFLKAFLVSKNRECYNFLSNENDEEKE